MKSIVKAMGIGAICAAMLFGTAGCSQGTATGKNTITAVGAGSVKVTPDLAKIYLGVNTDEETAELAKQKNAEIMSNVIAKLKELGLTDDSIKTGSYSITPSYSYDEQTGEQHTISYFVTNMITITTEKVDGVADIIDKATQAGSNINNGIDFTLKDKEEHYNSALKLAIENANKKAGIMAESMGKTLGQPINVKENQTYDSYTSYAYYENTKSKTDMGAGYSTPISYNDIEVTANVEVTYQY